MRESIGKKLGIIAGRMHLYEFLSKIGVEAFIYRKVYKRQILEAKDFYDDNRIRVEHVKSLLYDETSREAYRKAIAFRTTHKLKDRPDNAGIKEYYNEITAPELLSNNEIILDCGACCGDTVLEAFNFYSDKVAQIVAFEPDKENYNTLLKNVAQFGAKVVPIEGGVWNEQTVLSFTDGQSSGSRVESDAGKGNTSINVYAIDQLDICKNATFIKMDIEGSELNALNGAINTIQNNRPILTICIYHTNEDMLSILEWMEKNLTNYRLFCRHHSYFIQDTIVYAIPEERYDNSKATA